MKRELKEGTTLEEFRKDFDVAAHIPMKRELKVKYSNIIWVEVPCSSPYPYEEGTESSFALTAH